MTHHDEPMSTVSVIRSSKIRYLRLRVTNAGAVIVKAPRHIPDMAISQFLKDKQHWISRQKLHARSAYEELTTNAIGSSVRLQHYLSDKYDAEMVDNRTIRLFHPRTYSAQSLYASAARPNIRLALLANAQQDIEPIVHQLSRQNNMSFASLRFRYMRSRWGSCTIKKDITLNAQLLRLPQPAIEYVIAHELCHTQAPHHQRDFWNLLGHIVPDYRLRRNDLRQYMLWV